MVDLAITEINAGDCDDGAELVISYNGRRVSVSLYPSTLQPDNGRSDTDEPAAEDYLIRLLERCARPLEDEDEYEELTEQILIIILDKGKDFFDELKADTPDVQPQLDLHSVLYPESFSFQLLTVSGELSLVPIDPQEAYTCPEPLFDPYFESDVHIKDHRPRYTPKEVVIEKSLLRGSGRSICRVLVGGKVVLCKARTEGLANPALERELGKLQKIQEADLHAGTGVRIPQLHGYVIHPSAGYVIGLLRDWIPGQPLMDFLRDTDISAMPEARRRKWASQIRGAVDRLHGAGLIWGDAKDGNVVVDTEDDAWLIDFGGGWTEGWVDRELEGMVAGDEQGVQRIIKLLGVD